MVALKLYKCLYRNKPSCVWMRSSNGSFVKFSCGNMDTNGNGWSESHPNEARAIDWWLTLKPDTITNIHFFLSCVSCHACPCLQVNRDNSVWVAAFVPVCCNRPLYSQHRRPTKSQRALHLMSIHTFSMPTIRGHFWHRFSLHIVQCDKVSRLEPKATHSETSFVLCELCFGLWQFCPFLHSWHKD